VHHRIFPLMQVNFVEANPVPVKAAMAAMGLLEDVYRLPMCSPRPESKEKILRVLKQMNLLSPADVSAEASGAKPEAGRHTVVQ
jgi:4-hydroxy-tetrahydrodipicolinate synthase